MVIVVSKKRKIVLIHNGYAPGTLWRYLTIKLAEAYMQFRHPDMQEPSSRFSLLRKPSLVDEVLRHPRRFYTNCDNPRTAYGYFQDFERVVRRHTVCWVDIPPLNVLEHTRMWELVDRLAEPIQRMLRKRQFVELPTWTLDMPTRFTHRFSGGKQRPARWM